MASRASVDLTMTPTLVLDAEALHALARPDTRGALGLRARAILTVAHELRAPVRVPAPVLAEVCRGPRFDAGVQRVLSGRGVVVVDLTAPLAREAGRLLARHGLASAHAVDAFVVVTAASFDAAIIATADPDDIGRLCDGMPRVTVLAL